jgi:hypothetical protein
LHVGRGEARTHDESLEQCRRLSKFTALNASFTV